MRMFYRREWDESRGDAYDDWGTSVWYFDVEDGWACRQVAVYANGNVLKYDEELVGDEYGQLAEKALDAADFEPFIITEAAFDRVWETPRKVEAPAPSSAWVSKR